MKQKKLSQEIISTILFLLAMIGCSPRPPMVIVSTPIAPIKVKDAYIQTVNGQDKVLPPVFSSGVEQLNLIVEFEFIPDDTNLNREVFDRDGKIELDDTFFSMGVVRNVLENTNAATVIFYLRPKSGSFADGSYQAIITIDNIPTIELNWTVGK